MLICNERHRSIAATYSASASIVGIHLLSNGINCDSSAMYNAKVQK